MKNYKIFNKLSIGVGIIISLLFMGCLKDVKPSTAIDSKSALSNPGDLATATIGVYSELRTGTYAVSGHFLMEYPSDDVAQSQPSTDDISNCYKITTQIPTGSRASDFWNQAYFMIVAANNIIAAIPDNASSDLLQLKGENLYLRAMAEFNLVRIFGRPYTQGNGDNPGVPLLQAGVTVAYPARNTVQEVYTSVIADLLQSANLMTVAKPDVFASKEVAYALLSRVYLYMNDNQDAIKYADLVINSGRYQLQQGTAYQSYFTIDPESNPETIFAIDFTKTQDLGFGSIGSLYYSSSTTNLSVPGPQGNTGYAEVYASQTYYQDLAKNPGDLRLSFISPYTVNGVLQYNQKLNPATPMYYINKYTLQDGIVTLSSPVYLRLAEMYLNRAEANAKLGNSQEAIDDVNIIRTRAQIPTLTLGTIQGTVLSNVLEERRLELAFEGQRVYDLYRNNLPMIRNYPGTQSLLNSPTTNTYQIINPTDNRVIYYLPQSAIQTDKNLTQNP